MIVAAGNSYYGRMAYNLALSIKAKESIPIAVLHNGSSLAHLTRQQQGIFDEAVRIPDALTGLQAKLSMYKYCPFEETIYIDADNLWIPGKAPSQMFALFKKEVLFSGITEGIYYLSGENRPFSYIFWADPEEIILKWNIKHPFYAWRSEVLYFKKSELAEQLFQYALEVYENPRVDFDIFADTVPDELCINIAAARLHVAPHEFKWNPTYWPNTAGMITDMKKILNNYWILSTGGNSIPFYLSEMYNNFMQYTGNKMRMEYFKLRPKTLFLTERFNY